MSEESWVPSRRLRPRQRRSQIAAEPSAGDPSREAPSPWLTTVSSHQRERDVDHRTELEDEVDDLRERLATLPVIEQSKGLLMGQYGVSADVAFAILVRWSSYANVTMWSLGEQLIAAVADPDPGEPGSTALRRAIDRIQEIASP